MTDYKKRPIPQYLRRQVFERDNYTCRYCGRAVSRPHCDHVYPESRGGATELGNLVTSCRKCNMAKRASVGTWPMPADFQGRIGQLSGRVEELEGRNGYLEQQRQETEHSVMRIDILSPLLVFLVVAVVGLTAMTVGIETDRADWLLIGAAVMVVAMLVAVVLRAINRNLERRHRQALGAHVRHSHGKVTHE